MSEYLSQSVDYIGFLESKLRDLRGFSTLVYELIQNSDDAPEVTELSFNFQDDALIVENNGSFRKCDFDRIQNISSGGKREEESTTGAFGIGFISVYQITDHPEIFSSGLHWIFRPEEETGKRIVQNQIERSNKTIFKLPWAIDSNSDVRRKLRLEALSPENINGLIHDASDAIPKAMLFLRKLVKIVILHNGKIIKDVQRSIDNNKIILQDGTNTQVWNIIKGDFQEQAEQLRNDFRYQIENKRTSDICIAIPELINEIDGLLCAGLPTQQKTGLPFHINADFFTSSDRKKVLFEGDFQARWNEAAIKAAAQLVANELPNLRDNFQIAIWELISKTKSISEKTDQPLVFNNFWVAIKPILKNTKIILTSKNEWVYIPEAYLLHHLGENKYLSILERIPIALVHPELRKYFSILNEIGVPILKLFDLAKALSNVGLSRTIALKDSPVWISNYNDREQLIQEIEILYNDENDKNKAKNILRQCALGLCLDENLYCIGDIYTADEQIIKILYSLNIKIPFLSKENPKYITQFVKVFDAQKAIDLLEKCNYKYMENLWLDSRWAPKDILEWFSLRKGEILNNKGLKERLINLQIYPSGKQLCSLNNLSIPGMFDDPLNLSSLVDLKSLPNLRDFLVGLGATELTLKKYISQIPQLFKREKIEVELLKGLITLLADHLGEIRDDPNVLDILRSCQLILCNDNELRFPNDVYLNESVLKILDNVPVAYFCSKPSGAIIELYKWLGVLEEPLPRDILLKVQNIIIGKPIDNKQKIVKVIEHVIERWNKSDINFQNALKQPLCEIAWLPAKDDFTIWYHPKDINTTFRIFLFETQGKFLDIEQNIQALGAAFFEYLGVKSEPTIQQVIKHLLFCEQHNIQINREVYRFLNNHANEPLIKTLIDKKCLLLPNGSYVLPSYVFWKDNIFGRYRFSLDKKLRSYNDLFEQIGVRDLPTPKDAIDVLKDISNEFQNNNILDEDSYNILIKCWKMLNIGLEKNDIDSNELNTLKNIKVIPDNRKVLQCPGMMFFKDKTGLAEKFSGFIENNVIEHIEGAWRAMQAAGVQPLSQVVKKELIEKQVIGRGEELENILKERLILLKRIIDHDQDTLKISMEDIDKITRINFIKSRMLKMKYSLKLFNTYKATEPQEVAAYYDGESNTLYYKIDENGNILWSIISRELVYAISPDIEIGSLALSFKEVLSARTTFEASQTLDELDYPYLHEIENAVSPNIRVTHIGGLDETEDQNEGGESEEPRAFVPDGDDLVEDDRSEGDVAGTTTDNSEQGGWPGQPHGISAATSPRRPENVQPTEDSRGNQLGGVSGSPTPSGTRTSGSGHSNAGRSDMERGQSADDEDGSSGQSTASSRQLTAQRRLLSYVSHGNLDGCWQDTTSEGDSRRLRIGEAAVEIVIDYEKRNGRKARSMAHSNPGYDVISECDSETRYIEVKGTEVAWGERGVTLTPTQFFYTKENPNRDHWLYVVEDVFSSNPQIHKIHNPSEKVDYFVFDGGWRQAAVESAEGRGIKMSIPSPGDEVLLNDNVVGIVEKTREMGKLPLVFYRAEDGSLQRKLLADVMVRSKE
jgi:hypothetical protein